MRFLSVIGLSLALLSLFSCAASEDPDLSVTARWLTPTGALPADVATITVVVVRDGEDGGESQHTVSLLPDEDMNGAVELVRSGLPVGEAFGIRVEGFRAGEGVSAYVGHVGPIFLQPGERRYVDLTMYERGAFTRVTSDAVGTRVLHTMSTLPDGRVLIAGGFDEVSATACPIDAPAMSMCLDMTATNTAVVFDVATGEFFSMNPMSTARGGHTSNVTSTGRVVLAGGAERALMVITPVDATGANHDVVFRPLKADGTSGALASFTLFDPEANPEVEDTDRDGDPGRGGFVSEGTLNDERFLHASAPVPDSNQFLFAGGYGTGSGSFELYDDQRPGGPGVYDNATNLLGVARTAPVAVSAGSRVLIFGGSDEIATNAQLADSYTAAAGLTPFTDSVTGFPNTLMDPEPGYALQYASGIALGSGAATRAFVTGWYGPRCDPGATMPQQPTFVATSGMELSRCAAPSGTVVGRSFVVDAITGQTNRISPMAPPVFGTMTAFGTSTIALAGGFTTGLLNAVNGVQLFGQSAAGTPPIVGNVSMNDARAMHAAAAVRGGGLLITGGMRLTLSGGVPTVMNVDSAEIIFR